MNHDHGHSILHWEAGPTPTLHPVHHTVPVPAVNHYIPVFKLGGSSPAADVVPPPVTPPLAPSAPSSSAPALDLAAADGAACLLPESAAGPSATSIVAVAAACYGGYLLCRGIKAYSKPNHNDHPQKQAQDDGEEEPAAITPAVPFAGSQPVLSSVATQCDLEEAASAAAEPTNPSLVVSAQHPMEQPNNERPTIMHSGSAVATPCLQPLSAATADVPPCSVISLSASPSPRRLDSFQYNSSKKHHQPLVPSSEPDDEWVPALGGHSAASASMPSSHIPRGQRQQPLALGGGGSFASRGGGAPFIGGTSLEEPTWLTPLPPQAMSATPKPQEADETAV